MLRAMAQYLASSSPAISVPAGLSEDRLPLGIQLIGKPWDEPTVLRAARVVEATLSF